MAAKFNPWAPKIVFSVGLRASFAGAYRIELQWWGANAGLALRQNNRAPAGSFLRSLSSRRPGDSTCLIFPMCL